MENLITRFDFTQAKSPVGGFGPLTPDVENETKRSDWVLMGETAESGRFILRFGRQAIAPGQGATVLWSVSASLQNGEYEVPLSWLETQGSQDNWGASDSGFFLEGENAETLQDFQVQLVDGRIQVDLVPFHGRAIQLRIQGFVELDPPDQGGSYNKSNYWGLWSEGLSGTLTLGPEGSPTEELQAVVLLRNTVKAPSSSFGPQWVRIGFPDLALPGGPLIQTGLRASDGVALRVETDNSNFVELGADGRVRPYVLQGQEWAEHQDLSPQDEFATQPGRQSLGLGYLIWALIAAAVLTIIIVPVIKASVSDE